MSKNDENIKYLFFYLITQITQYKRKNENFNMQIIGRLIQFGEKLMRYGKTQLMILLEQNIAVRGWELGVKPLDKSSYMHGRDLREFDEQSVAKVV